MTRPAHTWRKSSYSTNTGDCVELCDTGAEVLLRDSKHPDQGHLTLTRTEIAALVTAARTGAFDTLTGA